MHQTSIKLNRPFIKTSDGKAANAPCSDDPEPKLDDRLISVDKTELETLLETSPITNPAPKYLSLILLLSYDPAFNFISSVPTF
jgi:hypothetical protein